MLLNKRERSPSPSLNRKKKKKKKNKRERERERGILKDRVGEIKATKSDNQIQKSSSPDN
jgi:hypothetical protein